MSCPADFTQDWLAAFRARAARTRTPVAVLFELTRRCNLRCVHCYLGDQIAQHRRQAEELSTPAIKEAMAEWVAAGCLTMTLTGGEPLLHPDFAEIYRHARELGLVVTVFTNGTLVTPETVSLFQEFPPRKVEISLYGATAATHDRVTGQPGSHARAWAGIRRLLAGGVRVELKSVLLTLNRHELDALEAQARECGVPFRHDAAIFPRLADGSPEPLTLRVPPAEAVAADLATPERRSRWREKINRTAELPESDRLYPCTAGQTSFHADPFGGVSPCLLATDFYCAPSARSFARVWAEDLGAIRQCRRTRPDGSLVGPARGACTHCPAVNRLETGAPEVESDYARATTRLRHAAAQQAETGDAP
ncbi:MAG TPA: radical SAM protein [Kiritimatiellia bacterium]|jgi:MoaA/NifB/PqqE/SkfB family radical SAM enzyme|nr:radical SAM protein [Kiritimatiellia bacterium]OQC56425.1 MAG: Antilisterial bacteriocin subtilosin biosynthesis protein AlbA [Verrucomicrobia bacterium ADurb.Bin018]MBP9573039.1 radical SAM protein [Kiritimatiellia bacterium]HOD99898.1 radical SAM protein [Kiritimatiellia bacterium]HOE36568.1 radical SAM protein [Kiritimatiellia bacterium]